MSATSGIACRAWANPMLASAFVRQRNRIADILALERASS
jgi:hypothetical protein